jgi:hypothetical protein
MAQFFPKEIPKNLKKNKIFDVDVVHLTTIDPMHSNLFFTEAPKKTSGFRST